ncbi:MAG: type II toxin-antitoxin system mRNA interferase toxin, RelE/StbE family [Candidatus Moeniiplasma glomeromycotorum]|nr:type II toxin-antitoxin system mRNA interferase toxin, RelE/StbE family [Candidatus Moeniiplasma glomeromycotorum]MCE8168146.1 type II toxin-antitoxin system mRNA interferase toxin, RelE/StbE family [Candidatus Moeniiplasma glomeromycotorum]MCE8169791.1 type II toxin-antitoxin system mRNA interferase toxin, RelE/StbE family [Candidatus Moeniiplasma glomeromycotorum]
MYRVEWKDEALEGLAEIGLIGKKIKDRVENELVKNPKGQGSPLTGDLKNLWSYRCYGRYRVVYQILETKLLIIVVEAGRRKNIYRKLSRKS